jgi:hypothetical protein
VASLEELEKRYAKQIANPALKRLGQWRMPNDDQPHDEEAYKRRLIETAPAIHKKTEEALKGI